MRILSKAVLSGIMAISSVLVSAGGLDTLQKFNSDTDGISGQFTQTVHSKKRTQTTSGTFAIQRPGLFRWEYTQPYKQTIVGDGKTVWLYDQDLAQVTKQEQNQTIGDSPAAILSNKSALNANYSLSDDGSSDGVDYVRAIPKRSNTGYQNIRIGFRGDNLANMQLKDSFGNQTTITFSKINTHPQFNRSQFKFTPPKGVDVLTQ
ncbi:MULTISPECIES: outer membrane lipoprotein chaperone LolA [Snodgrassella]|uniref:Outer-membrane lipoprotein carrier protein n=1 Tax=Snodgrassella alvi TaxID=1196083 RepID=A0A2N9WVA2_9NEIS|nr:MULTISPECIES: outer membrane lipoprotein chaperone LolA [Snodgrassella]NUE66837.1 outer membrane lipoprotein chaperone LolA [Snodgrassella sp. ESL0253]PIT16887.1 outer membrane lipoprotein carrier protein LolA [Snodgrassella alvi]PIT18533.1 outer membrane lipoprotein carrier protein LolA [Snodgrassella alvi]PIT21990.1 outer membrane lipoprotein carrier protein LolA [Snodgrassella alvi]